ncbi:MAG: hypothetical protein ABGZ53_35010 [Fuerstiella sp.]
MTWLDPITLSCPNVSLELLNQRHHDDLVEAAGDGELWTLWDTCVYSIIASEWPTVKAHLTFQASR